MSKKEQKWMKRNLPLEFVKVLCELIYNMMNGNINVKEDLRGMLRKYKNKIKAVFNCKNGIRKKRELVQTGGLVHSVLDSITPNLINELLSDSENEE